MAEKTIGDVFNTMTEDQKQAAYSLVGWALELGINYLHGYCGRKGSNRHRTVSAYASMNSDQKIVVDFLINKAIDMYEKGD